MSYYKNLVPGQWQFGDIVAGYGTNIRVNSTDVKPYDINAQDYQVSRADQVRFGHDSLKPTTIEFEFTVLHNKLLPAYDGLIPNFWHSQPTVEDLAYEWKFDEGRQQWGQMKPLYVCSRFDEIPKIIFGRPGQFNVTQNDIYGDGEAVGVIAEFRRGDTLAYSLGRNFLNFDHTSLEQTIPGTNGKGLSWIVIYLGGPITDPVITFDGLFNQASAIDLELDVTLATGEWLEINGEPWSRRVMTRHTPVPINLASQLIGASPYLDRLAFNFNQPLTISLAGSGITSSTWMQVLWRESYQVI